MPDAEDQCNSPELDSPIKPGCSRARFATIELAVQPLNRVMDAVGRSVICSKMTVSVNQAFRR